MNALDNQPQRSSSGAAAAAASSSSQRPLHHVKQEELAVAKHRVPTMYEALIQYDSLLLNAEARIELKESELDRCVKVGHEVLSQLHLLRERYAAVCSERDVLVDERNAAEKASSALQQRVKKLETDVQEYAKVAKENQSKLRLSSQQETESLLRSVKGLENERGELIGKLNLCKAENDLLRSRLDVLRQEAADAQLLTELEGQRAVEISRRQQAEAVSDFSSCAVLCQAILGTSSSSSSSSGHHQVEAAIPRNVEELCEALHEIHQRYTDLRIALANAEDSQARAEMEAQRSVAEHSEALTACDAAMRERDAAMQSLAMLRDEVSRLERETKGLQERESMQSDDRLTIALLRQANDTLRARLREVEEERGGAGGGLVALRDATDSKQHRLSSLSPIAASTGRRATEDGGGSSSFSNNSGRRGDRSVDIGANEVTLNDDVSFAAVQPPSGRGGGGRGGQPNFLGGTGHRYASIESTSSVSVQPAAVGGATTTTTWRQQTPSREDASTQVSLAASPGQIHTAVGTNKAANILATAGPVPDTTPLRQSPVISNMVADSSRHRSTSASNIELRSADVGGRETTSSTTAAMEEADSLRRALYASQDTVASLRSQIEDDERRHVQEYSVVFKKLTEVLGSHVPQKTFAELEAERHSLREELSRLRPELDASARALQGMREVQRRRDERLADLQAALGHVTVACSGIVSSLSPSSAVGSGRSSSLSPTRRFSSSSSQQQPPNVSLLSTEIREIFASLTSQLQKLSHQCSSISAEAGSRNSTGGGGSAPLLHFRAVVASDSISGANQQRLSSSPPSTSNSRSNSPSGSIGPSIHFTSLLHSLPGSIEKLQGQFDLLLDQGKQKEDQIRLIKIQVEERDAQATDTDRSRQEIVEQLKSSSSIRHQMEVELQKLATEHDQVLKDRERLTAANALLSSEQNRLEKKLALLEVEAKKSAQDLDADVKSLRQRLEQAKEQLNKERQEHLASVEQLYAEMAELKRLLADATAAKDETGKSLSSALKQVEALQQTAALHEASSREYNTRSQRLSSMLKVARDELQNVQQTLIHMSESQNADKAEYEQRIAEFEQRLEEASSKVRSLESERSSISTSLRDAHETQHHNDSVLLHQISTLQRDLDEAQVQLSMTRHELGSLQEHLASIAEANDGLSRSVDVAGEEVKALRSTVTTLEARVLDVESDRDMLRRQLHVLLSMPRPQHQQH